MKTRRVPMRQRIVASIASAALAMSMVVAVPMSALAANNQQDDLVVPTSELNVVTGQMALCNTSAYNDESMNVHVASMVTSSYHLDFKIDTSVANTAGASVNKHTGVLTTTSEGTATVIVNLVSGDMPTKNPSNPCSGCSVLDTESFTVKASATSAYTFQGVNNAIKMTSPTVSTFSGSNSNGWENHLSAMTADNDGWYYFTIQMTSGFKTYNTAIAFAGRNAGAVTLKNSAGSELASLNANNNGPLQVDSVDVDSKTVVFKVASSAVASSGDKLVFDSSFRGNSDSSTLGTTVAFVIR